MKSKAEIKTIFEKYHVTVDNTLSENEDIIWILNNIQHHIPSEKPDAYLENQNTVYGIEHFQISHYETKNKQDISRVAEGSQQNREKMKGDRDFSHNPSVNNLINALNLCLESHSKSFSSYAENVISIVGETKDYKLIIYVEDYTKSGYIVKHRDTKIINPLNLKQLIECLLKYKDQIWGVIYSYGNEIEKTLTGCTLEELEDKNSNNQLLDADQYVPFEVKREVHVSKEDSTQDQNIVTINLSDSF